MIGQVGETFKRKPTVDKRNVLFMTLKKRIEKQHNKQVQI